MAIIRVAGPQDAAAIAHVHVQSWLTTYAGIVPDSYLATLNGAERVPLWQDRLTLDINVFVAELDGKVVGFGGGGPIREPLQAFDAELYTLYLLKDAQRKGIGSALLHAVRASLADKGFTRMMTWVLEQNPAVHFYKASGAQLIESKQIEIGGIQLPELALGWPPLGSSTRLEEK